MHQASAPCIPGLHWEEGALIEMGWKGCCRSIQGQNIDCPESCRQEEAFNKEEDHKGLAELKARSCSFTVSARPFTDEL